MLIKFLWLLLWWNKASKKFLQLGGGGRLFFYHQRSFLLRKFFHKWALISYFYSFFYFCLFLYFVFIFILFIFVSFITVSSHLFFSLYFLPDPPLSLINIVFFSITQPNIFPTSMITTLHDSLGLTWVFAENDFSYWLTEPLGF